MKIYKENIYNSTVWDGRKRKIKPQWINLVAISLFYTIIKMLNGTFKFIDSKMDIKIILFVKNN